MATISDVAEEAGVSVATVSHVINGTRYVSPELTERVKKAMDELGYHRNAVARSLKTDKTQTIGLIASDLSNPFFSTLLRGVEDKALEKDHSLIVCNTDETLAKEKLYVDVLSERKIDGLLIAPTGKSDENLLALKDRDIPLVFIDRKVEGLDAGAVLSTNVKGSAKAMRHLIELGHRRIGIILGLQSVTTSQERLEGYRKALKEEGITFDSRLVKQGYSQVAGGSEAAMELLSLDSPPTAIFSANNLMTIGAMQGIQEAGFSCPEEVSLVGFDDFEWAATFKPNLTTVAQSPYEIGSRAAEILFENIQNGDSDSKEVRIPTKLKIRDSSTVARTSQGGE
ncbi:LacI family DNA-binding transcriptional regulator [Candidatus Bipolaricaulota bacterium]|nr:LacI family DNA-binding transcriptional regulator [Candidatus Bipolaricaulota bacterium]